MSIEEAGFKQNWKAIRNIFKDTFKEAFPKYPYRILNKQFDSIRREKVFSIKVHRIAATVSLTAKEIFNRPEYLTGLSYDARSEITKQYLLDISKPPAYIEEYPVSPNEQGNRIFKIMLVDEKRIVCGTASFFIKNGMEILSRLSTEDTVKIAAAYYEDRFSPPEKEFVAPIKGLLKITR